MHILDVELACVRTCPDTGRVSAMVNLLTDAGGMNMQASAAHCPATDTRSLLDALMQDVLRQIQFLPEIRTAAARVTVAPDALDRAARQG
jgi:hypothetical protein